jgi:hypothetical protein
VPANVSEITLPGRAKSLTVKSGHNRREQTWSKMFIRLAGGSAMPELNIFEAIFS